jgi:hypothetical protein
VKDFFDGVDTSTDSTTKSMDDEEFMDDEDEFDIYAESNSDLSDENKQLEESISYISAFVKANRKLFENSL